MENKEKAAHFSGCAAFSLSLIDKNQTRRTSHSYPTEARGSRR
jgi:hypothetical protein